MQNDEERPKSRAGYHTRDMHPRGHQGSTRVCQACSTPGDFKCHQPKDCPQADRKAQK